MYLLQPDLHGGIGSVGGCQHVLSPLQLGAALAQLDSLLGPLPAHLHAQLCTLSMFAGEAESAIFGLPIGLVSCLLSTCSIQHKQVTISRDCEGCDLISGASVHWSTVCCAALLRCTQWLRTML